MNTKGLVEMLRQGNVVIPLYLFHRYKDWKLSLEEFLFLMLLYNKGEVFSFDPQSLGKEMNEPLEKIMEWISSLSEKHFLRVEVQKNEKGFHEEMIDMKDFYMKLSLLLLDENKEVEENTSRSVFSMIEKEFGRTLSPIEFEIIKAWIDNQMSEEMIKEAVKEATFNGVSNLRYIDKILYEWGKKGIKTREDVERQRKKRIQETKESSVDVFDYDWFDDEE